MYVAGFDPKYLTPYRSVNNFTEVKISDLAKFARVKDWVDANNPVIGTCRCCGYTGIIDSPCIGLY